MEFKIMDKWLIRKPPRYEEEVKEEKNDQLLNLQYQLVKIQQQLQVYLLDIFMQFFPKEKKHGKNIEVFLKTKKIKWKKNYR